MEPVNLKSFKQKVRYHKPAFRKFLNRLKKNRPRGLTSQVAAHNTEVWKEMNCLSCGNCCKTMSPTYSKTDIRRISNFLGISQKEFIKKWLYKDKHGDWLNKQQPCQFFDLATNMCTVYEVRPKDCAGFPHHTKRRMLDYLHIYKQNIEYCPATYRWVEKMMERAEEEENVKCKM